MIERRAIVLVPGYGNFTRGQRRDVLIHSLVLNDPLPVEPPEDFAIEGDAAKRLRPRKGVASGRPDVDIFEVSWSDLLPKSELASPLVRFWKATSLIVYWGFHPWWLAALRANRSLTLGLLVSVTLVFLWYLTIFFALLGFLTKAGAADTIAASLSNVLSKDVVGPLIADALKWVAPLAKRVIESLGSAPAILLVCVALLRVETIVALADFVRLYLKSGSTQGYQGEIAQRVQDSLERIYAARTEDGRPLYDEVVLLGHSMGGAIALEALANYGNPEVQARTVLVTWGSPLPVLCYRSPARVRANVERAAKGAVPRWIDYYSSDDWLSTKLKLRGIKAVHSVPLAFPTAWWQGVSAEAHNQYYHDETTLTALLGPELMPAR